MTQNPFSVFAVIVIILFVFFSFLQPELTPECFTGMLCGTGGLIIFVVIVISVSKSIQAKKQRQAHAQQQLQQQEILALTRNIYSLSPEEFEQYVGILFQKQGYQVQHVGKTGDLGIDLRMSKNGTEAIVQCKRYNADNKIDVTLVREFRGVMARENINLGFIVTTTQFTTNAEQEAQAMQDVTIKLVDGDKLAMGAKQLGLPGIVMFK